MFRGNVGHLRLREELEVKMSLNFYETSIGSAWRWSN